MCFSRLPYPAFLLALVLLICGCSESGDPVGPGSTDDSALSGTLSASGGTLTSADGRLSITIPPGALTDATTITLSPIALSEIDSVFGDFEPKALLKLEPVELSLSSPAAITYKLTTGAKEQNQPDPEDPEEAEFLIGAHKTETGVEIPNQRANYDLNPGALFDSEITINTDRGGQIPIGSILMHPLGRFAAIFGPDEFSQPPIRGVSIEFILQLEMADETQVEFGEPIFDSDPLAIDVTPNLSDGETWQPDQVTDLGTGRVMLVFGVDLIPERDGLVVFGAKLGGKLVLVDPDATGLQLGNDPAIGELDFSITMPELNLTVLPSAIDYAQTIETGMTGLEGLCYAFGTIDDPAPLGNPYHPWLYVDGAEGVQYYRLAMADGLIESVELIESIVSLEAEGVIAASADYEGEFGRTLLILNRTQSWMTNWNPLGDAYGMMVLVSSNQVFDAVTYGDTPHSRGISFGRGFGAYFLEYNSVLGKYLYPIPPGGPLAGYLFPGDGGDIVSCLVDPSTLGALVIKDGLPGEIWFHTRQDIISEGVLIGYTQNEPKQIRSVNGFCGISNHISNSLTTFRWDGGSGISNVTTTAVGIGPHGIDMVLLNDATMLVVSTSPPENSYYLSHFGISGALLGSRAYPLPEGNTGPRHAVFLDVGDLLSVAVSCFDSGTVVIIPVDTDGL